MATDAGPSTRVPTEQEPLLATDDDPSAAHTRSGSHHPDDGKQGVLALVARNATSGGVARMAQLGLLMVTIPVWIIALANPAGLFTPHPLLQTVGAFILLQGILLLQPTRTAAAKRSGLQAHQVAQGVGLLALAAGVSVIYINKSRHGGVHFATWHGRFGIATVSIMVIQAIFGALVAFPATQQLFGSTGEAKSLWKYHRASGYLLVLLMVMTVSLAVSDADWFVQHSSFQERSTVNVGLFLATIGVVGRLSPAKLPKFRRS